MAPPQRVRAAQRHDLAVVEAHAAREDGAEVLCALRRVREARLLARAAAVGKVGAPGSPLDLRAAHLLDGDGARERVEVGVRQPRELLLDGLEQRARDREAGVGAVRGLGVEAHGGAVAASAVGLGVVRAGAVPREAHEHRAVGPVVVALRVENVDDGLADGVVVVGLGCRGGNRGDAAEEVVEEAVFLGVPEARAAGDDEEGPGLVEGAREGRERRESGLNFSGAIIVVVVVVIAVLWKKRFIAETLHLFRIQRPQRFSPRLACNIGTQQARNGPKQSQRMAGKATRESKIVGGKSTSTWEKKRQQQSFLTALSVAAVAPSRARELTARVERTGASRRAATRNIVLVFEEGSKKGRGRKVSMLSSVERKITSERAGGALAGSEEPTRQRRGRESGAFLPTKCSLPWPSGPELGSGG